ncbi:flp-20 [Pristionchus pacificus]|uniref:Uncharacterized protein n=1 Tax=Pristionchus pacificus TaxID=54126 RepID=A0A8R1V5Q7_PRIPA|nr:flp-20 [Pristionchus pacificus]
MQFSLVLSVILVLSTTVAAAADYEPSQSRLAFGGYSNWASGASGPDRWIDSDDVIDEEKRAPMRLGKRAAFRMGKRAPMRLGKRAPMRMGKRGPLRLDDE